MKKSYLLILLLPLMAASAQWDYVPLQGGYIEHFTKNPFNENDLFATVYSIGFLYSSDRGNTWDVLTPDFADYTVYNVGDIAVAPNGWLYTKQQKTSPFYLFRSTDWGGTWSEQTLPGGGRISLPFGITTADDGTMYLTNPDARSVWKSTDNGNSWDSVLAVPRNMFMPRTLTTVDGGDLVIVHGTHGSLFFTEDAGATWRNSTDFIGYEDFLDIFGYKRNGTTVLGLWAVIFNGPDVMPQQQKWMTHDCEYFESTDLGRTWTKLATVQIPHELSDIARKGSGHAGTAVLPNNTLVSLMDNTLYRSTDLGQTWTEEPAAKGAITDITNFADTLIGSIVGKGIVRSTDEGRTWAPVQSVGELGMFSNVEFDMIAPNEIYALTRSQYNRKTVHRIVYSTNAGQTWSEEFRAEIDSPHDTSVMKQWYRDLAVTDATAKKFVFLEAPVPGGQSAYYSIKGGTVGSSQTQTLLTGLKVRDTFSDRDPFLVQSPVDPEVLYLTLQDAADTSPHMYVTTDAGQTWSKVSTPSDDFGYINILPSRLDAGKFLAVCAASDRNDIDQEGYWVATSYGNQWTHVSNEMPVARQYNQLFGNDVLFERQYHRFSTDFGATWVTNTNGMTTEHVNMVSQPFVANGELYLVGNDLGLNQIAGFWYKFNGSAWERMYYTQTNTPVWFREFPQEVWYDNNTFWAAFPYFGIRKLDEEVFYFTGVEDQLLTPDGYALSAYPNPVSGTGSIQFTLPNASEVQVDLYDALGRNINTAAEGYYPGGTHSIPFSTEGLPAGVYICTLRSGSYTVSSRIVVHP